MANFYCKFCGHQASSIASLTYQACQLHPDGSNKGKHILYEGSEKPKYFCKYCGANASSIAHLTYQNCPKHPKGAHKGRHEPAL